MNSADQLIYNASLLAEAGEVDGAIAALEDAIALSEVAAFPLQRLRARLLLGELLLHEGREEEAITQLREVLLVSEELAEEAGSVDEEVAVAKEYLDRLGGGTA